MKQIRFIYKYFKHAFSAKHTRGFRIHSPFIYNFNSIVPIVVSDLHIETTTKTKFSQVFRNKTNFTSPPLEGLGEAA